MSALSAELLNAIREQFPALHQEVNCKPLVYLDNGATTQKAQSGYRRPAALLRARQLQRAPWRAYSQ